MEKLAFAKVNIVLDIKNKRSDGYHNLESIMVRLSLADRITIDINDAGGIVICSNKEMSASVEDNLIYRAAMIMKEMFQIQQGMTFKVVKEIPIGAGLGGGSSDAATTILLINDYFNLNLSKHEMSDIGARLGADIPFFIHECSAYVKGIGEQVSSIPIIDERWVILIKPTFPVSTKVIFENLSLESINHIDVAEIVQHLSSGDEFDLYENLFNNMEETTFELYPEVKKIKNKLIELGYKNTIMSGSGPTVFSILNEKPIEEDLSVIFPPSNFEVFITKLKV